jgi:hypothetical protein
VPILICDPIQNLALLREYKKLSINDLINFCKVFGIYLEGATSRLKYMGKKGNGGHA